MDFLGLVERNTAILGKSFFVGGGVDFLGLVERNTAILGGPLKESFLAGEWTFWAWLKGTPLFLEVL